MRNKGYLIIYTGNGKGKTCAALGQALRAAGHGLKVCIIQFIKANDATGEAKMLGALADQIELHVMGSGFTWQAGDGKELQEAASKGWRLAREKIQSDAFDMVILDELTYLPIHNLLPETEIIEFLQTRPERLHIVVTGRGASQKLIAAADLVTEMVEISHPYQQGFKARKGIEL
ncbi:MAG: cob(I)yrinic acid a,c-diamide adenosyltransferase [Deltaproteobacteria bacterium RIFOXYD12_FULL_50_9]|nr:MAG: cob(I)yrinic acid a,c-diamide adenosyltransferase [Deltaproteobacteria bacterium RIFOXYD12_FULL_50_9]